MSDYSVVQAFSLAGPKMLPDHMHVGLVVIPKGAVFGHESHAFVDALANEDAIERVGVVGRQCDREQSQISGLSLTSSPTETPR
jgi:hypothetical protein